MIVFYLYLPPFLQQAKQALALNDSINQRIGGSYPQPTPPPEVDPFQGAQEAMAKGGSAGLQTYLSGIKDKDTRKSVISQLRSQAETKDQNESAGAMDIVNGYVESGDSSVDNSAMDIEQEPETAEENWNNSLLGKAEKTVQALPGAIDASNKANNEAYSSLKNNDPGPSIPGVGTFKKSAMDMDKTKVAGKKKNYGNRADGTPKGPGFFGELPGPDGTVSTEVSIGVNFDGQETEIPLLVPTLSQEEINAVLQGGQIPDGVIQKAIKHAKMRISQGKSPFAEDGEQVNNIAMK